MVIVLGLIFNAICAVVFTILILRRYSKVITQQHDTSFRQGWEECEEWVFSMSRQEFGQLQDNRSK